MRKLSAKQLVWLRSIAARHTPDAKLRMFKRAITTVRSLEKRGLVYLNGKNWDPTPEGYALVRDLKGDPS